MDASSPTKTTNHVAQVVGIPNPVGTACHVNSVLLLLYYSIPPLRQILCTASSGGSHVVPALSDVFQQVQKVANNETRQDCVVNPSALYQALQSDLHISATVLGDAVTCLSKILEELGRPSVTHQTTTSAADDAVALVVQAALGTGRATLQLQATYATHRRVPLKVKKPKPWPMLCSLSTGPSSCTSTLEECWQAYGAPTVVEGYQWQAGSYREEELVSSLTSSIPSLSSTDQDDVRIWTTTKQKTVEALPEWWIVHLDRSQNPVAAIEIPLIWPDLNRPSDGYRLTGAILHVQPKEPLEVDEESYGHYVTLIPCSYHGNPLELCDNNEDWYLMDDDKVSCISVSQATRLMAGGDTVLTYPLEHEKEEPEMVQMNAVLLVYQSPRAMEILQPVLEKAIHQWNEQQQKSAPSGSEWIGRRLRIKWAKEKYYSGVITDYQDGKHTVQYDDGDVKRYVLSKKTIIWE